MPKEIQVCMCVSVCREVQSGGLKSSQSSRLARFGRSNKQPTESRLSGLGTLGSVQVRYTGYTTVLWLCSLGLVRHGTPVPEERTEDGVRCTVSCGRRTVPRRTVLVLVLVCTVPYRTVLHYADEPSLATQHAAHYVCCQCRRACRLRESVISLEPHRQTASRQTHRQAHRHGHTEEQPSSS